MQRVTRLSNRRTIVPSFLQRERKGMVVIGRRKGGEGKDGGRYTRDGTAVGKGGGKERWRRRRRRVASLAAVVFQGMLGGRFPRGLCYRLGRMTSPRYQILNLLAPAAYPRQGIQTFPPTDRQRSLRVSLLVSPSIHGSPPLSAIKTYA